MTDKVPADGVRTFFDRQQETHQYESLKAMTLELDEEAARVLNSAARGDVLSVGGIWDFFSWEDQLQSLTVLDLSSEMLKSYCPADATGIVGDFYDHDFGDERFDTIVFPLMLHHTPQGNWHACEARVVEAIERAHGLLREGGHLYIFEGCPAPAWMPVQRALLPVTKWFLARFGQPPVVVYSRAFYERVLTERFGSCEAKLVDPEGFDYRKWYPVFMAVRWLRMPLSVYPKLHVISAPAGA